MLKVIGRNAYRTCKMFPIHNIFILHGCNRDPCSIYPMIKIFPTIHDLVLTLLSSLFDRAYGAAAPVPAFNFFSLRRIYPRTLA